MVDRLQSPIILTAAVEGDLDEIVLRRLVAEAGLVLGTVYGKAGKSQLRNRIHDYNNAARFTPWIVLVDLDREVDSACLLRRRWLPEPAPNLMLRVAVRALEAWLLADGETISEFLGVLRNRVPRVPDDEPDPKRLLIEIARQSYKSQIRRDLVPRPGSGRTVGPAYSSRMAEFVESLWNPEAAAQRSDSLRRCRLRLRELALSG